MFSNDQKDEVRLRVRASLFAIAALAISSQPALSQMSAPPIPSVLPTVTRISAENAAGVLKYCERQQLVSVVSTDAILSSFAVKPDVRSADYVVGESGQILGDGKRNFSLSKAPGYLQSQACNMVLERAKLFRPSH